ncbi:hypothetical protein MLD38_008562 [Melastoma candidum]|uniref:Uncharacterized protein n=1 Tax=Melastoma candidum TaxID=119954 RepID=A0ACB9RTV0_9MYRT|nr:hypothetical protein MLD38_008562 [Melastoma candidum]
MSVLMSLPLVTPCPNQLKLFSLNSHRSPLKLPIAGREVAWEVSIWKDKALTVEYLHASSNPTRHFRGYSFTDSGTFSMDWGEGDRELEETVDSASPWEGAIIYKRNPSVTHVEYCTTLERLGMEKLSTDVSRNRASAMGIRVTNDVKDFLDGTPVQISVDVTRKKKKLRLDGIIKTVLTLGCNRYACKFCLLII